MAYTALQLITRSLYLSQIVARNLQTPTGSQIEDGLYLLNEIFDQKSSDLRLIPYFSDVFMPTVAGQEMYFFANCLYIDSLTFNIGSVRYSMWDQSRKDFFAGARVDNIESLPYSYRPERTKGGMNVYLYFQPGGVYEMRLWGKFALSDVILTTDLSVTYDGYYIAYLRYALAIKLCQEFGINAPDNVNMEFARIEKKLLDQSPADLKVFKAGYFGNQFGFDWQMANLYKGFLPF